MTRNVSANGTVDFDSKFFFKDICLTIVSDSYARVPFISGSENHKSHDNFSVIILIFTSFFCGSE